VGVDEGDGTLSGHPCHALFVVRKQRVQKFIQQTVCLLSLCLRLSGSFNAAVIAGIRARGQSCLPSGPMNAPSSSAALVYPPAHTHTSTGQTTTKHTTIKPNLDRKVGPTMNEANWPWVEF